MGRTPVTVRKTEFDACFLDRSAEECFPLDPGPSGTASFGTATDESVSPGIAQSATAVANMQASVQEPAVAPQHLWFQLAGSERQRFGQCFSLMVLKALGLRQVPFTEEQA
jgi:hypothetical protein